MFAHVDGHESCRFAPRTLVKETPTIWTEPNVLNESTAFCHFRMHSILPARWFGAVIAQVSTSLASKPRIDFDGVARNRVSTLVQSAP